MWIRTCLISRSSTGLHPWSYSLLLLYSFKKINRKSPFSLSFPQPSVSLLHAFWLVGCWTSFSRRWTMSRINVSPENPYGEVTIPRAKIRSPDDNATVIVNPMTMSSNEGNPPPYVVKEAGVEEEEEARSRTCCYRCRRKKWWEDCDCFRSIYFLVKTFSWKESSRRKWIMGTKVRWREKWEENEWRKVTDVILNNSTSLVVFAHP